MKLKEVSIRPGKPADMQGVFDLIHQLAVYEKAENELVITPETLVDDGFGEIPSFEALVAEHEGQIIGMALYYPTYSTWKGKSWYLEDFVVDENFRGHGVGKMIFNALVNQMKERECARLRWQVLDWNEPAIQFYQKIKAELDETWINCTLNKSDLEAW